MTDNELSDRIATGKLTEEELIALSPSDRRKLAGTARKLNGIFTRQRNAGGVPWQELGSKLTAARIAVIACCPFSDIKKLPWAELLLERWVGNERQPSPILDYLIRVDPDWLLNWSEWIYTLRGEEWNWSNRWKSVFRLVKAGKCRKPDSDAFAIEMLASFRGEGVGVEQFLIGEIEMLEPEIWRLFTFESANGMMLSSLDPQETRYAQQPRFSEALLELQHRGLLSRERLIESTFNAISSDFRAHANRWFLSFHEKLQFTDAEKIAHRNRYADALGSSAAETQKWALGFVGKLHGSGHLSFIEIAGYLESLIAGGNKGISIAAFRILETEIKRESADRASVLGTACGALSNPLLDIQERALKLIDKYGDPEDENLSSRLLDFAQSAAASLKQRYSRWFGLASALEALEEVSEPEITKTTILSEDRAITPVANYRELIELAAYLVENLSEIEEFERFLDGAVRLGGERPDEFESLTGSLKARVQKRYAQEWIDSSSFLLGCIGSWLDLNLKSSVGGVPSHSVVFFQKRIYAALEYPKNNKSSVLLAAPTHRGHWIDPVIFVSRLQCLNGQAPDLLDLIQALLRLAPENREQALEQAANLEGESGEAVRYALGAGKFEIGPTAALWVAACRCRNPFGDSPEVEAVHGGTGPGATRVCDYEYSHATLPNGEIKINTSPKTSFSIKLQPKPDIAFPTVGIHWSNSHAFNGFFATNAVIKGLHGIFPANPEAVAAKCVTIFSSLIASKSTSAITHAQAACAPFFEPWIRLGPMASLLVSTLLASSDAACRSLSADLLIQSVSDSRISESSIPRMLGELVHRELFPLQRLAPSFTDLSRVSSNHAKAAMNLCEIVLSRFRGTNSASVAPICELLGELSAQLRQPVQNRETIETLRRLSSSGKTGKIASRMLSALGETQAAKSKEIVIEKVLFFSKSRPFVPQTEPILHASRALKPLESNQDLEQKIIGLTQSKTDILNTSRFDLIWGSVSTSCGERIKLSAKVIANRGVISGFESLLRQATLELFYSWADRRDYLQNFKFEGTPEAAFLGKLLAPVARRAALGIALPMLSTPTHKGGWIAPLTLISRMEIWQEKQVEIDLTDLSLALFRLAPEDREAAVSGAKKIKGIAGDALRHTLKLQERPVDEVFEKNNELWSATIWARFCPQVTAHEKWRLQMRADSKWSLDWEEVTDTEALPNMRCNADIEMLGQLQLWTEYLAWCLTLVPGDPEPIFCRAARRLVDNSLGHIEQFSSYFLALFELAHPPLEESAALVLWALTLRTEDWKRVPPRIDHLVLTGKLAPEIAGRVLSQVLLSGMMLARDLSRRLTQIAEISPIHADWVLLTLIASFQGDPTRVPKDYRHLLLLALQLFRSRPAPLKIAETARNFLVKIPTRGITGSYAELLASEFTDA